MNAKTKAAVIKHGEQLLAIFPHATERDPVKLCTKLRRLEREGENIGLRLCNDSTFTTDEADRLGERILAKVDALLYYRKSRVPVFLNRDPRGYALKIQSEWMAAHPKKPLHRDWGDYGIIAPDLTE